MDAEKIKVSTEQSHPDGSFCMRMGRTTYQIGMYFSKTSKERLDTKVKRMMKKDMMAESSNLKTF